MNNENFKNYKLVSPVPRPSVIRDSRYYRKDKPSIMLKPSSAKLPKQGILESGKI